MRYFPANFEDEMENEIMVLGGEFQ